MAYDKNASPVGWYVASYVLRFIQLSEPGNDDPDKMFPTRENTILVKATSLDEAYDKAVGFAAMETRPYKGGETGVDVQWVYEGITSLVPVYEELADGSEIFFSENEPRKLETIRNSACDRSELRQ